METELEAASSSPAEIALPDRMHQLLDAVLHPDQETAAFSFEDLTQALEQRQYSVPTDYAKKLLIALRNSQKFDDLVRIAERLMDRNPHMRDDLQISYALGLLNSGQPQASIDLLSTALETSRLTAAESNEAHSMLGRAHLKIYLDGVRSASDPSRFFERLGSHLESSIHHYGRCYDPSRPSEHYWNGINLVALLNRARVDGVPIPGAADRDLLARGIIAALEPSAPGTTDHFQLATLGEAHLALGDIANSARYYAAFADHPKTAAFALNSAVRQLEEVWRLKVGKDGAAGILTGLKAALAQKKGGAITLSATEQQAIASATSAQHQEHFESRTRGGKFVPLAYLRRIVSTGMAVAAIKRKPNTGGVHKAGAGETVGTGFLIDGSTLGLDPSKSWLLTNAHVLWDAERGQGTENNALAPAETDIVFEGADGHGGVFACGGIFWQSPSGLHDATLFELDRRIDIPPLVIAPADVPLMLDDGSGKTRTALTVVGHPEGGALSIGLSGSIEEISPRFLDKGPRGVEGGPEFLHYTVPTEPGNSGSPVLETDGWTVVALHRAGFDEKRGRPKLNGKPGVNFASEGIYIHSIIDAVRRHLNILELAQAWLKAGRPRRLLLTAAKLKAVEAQIAAEPLSPWMAAEVAPFLNASRRIIPERQAARQRALAACLVLLPLVVALAAEWWISRSSYALSPPLPAFSSRIDRFIDPIAKPSGPAEQARAMIGHLITPPHAHESAIRDLAVSPDGTLAAVLSADNKVRLWELDTGKMKWEYQSDVASNPRIKASNPLAISFATDAKGQPIVILVVSNSDVVGIDATTGKTRDLSDVPGAATPIARGSHVTLPRSEDVIPDQSHDGMVVATPTMSSGAAVQDRVLGRGDGGVQWKSTGKTVHPLSHPAPVRAAAMSQDGKLAATGAADGSVILWSKDATDPTGWAGTRLGAAPAFDNTSAVTLTGHTDQIQSTHYSADGRRLVTTSSDDTTRVWDAKSGAGICTLKGHTGIVWTAAFSPDGTLIATSSEDNTARIWDAATCKEFATLKGHTNTIPFAAVSPDSTRVVTASLDDTAIVWEASTGNAIAFLKGHENWVLAAAFSPDGYAIATASADKTVRLWDAATGRQRAVFSGHNDGVRTVAFSPDGKLLVSASVDTTARVWDVATGQQLHELGSHSATVIGAYFSSDGARILTFSWDKTARTWDTATGGLITTLKGHEDGVSTAQFSRDGRMILTTSGDRTARLWDGVTGAELSLYQTGDKIAAADFSPDSQSIVIAEVNTARIIPVTRSACGGPCSSAAFLGDGSLLLTAGWGGKAQLWVKRDEIPLQVLEKLGLAKEPAAVILIADLDHGSAINRAFFNPTYVGGLKDEGSIGANKLDGSWHFATLGDDGTAKFWQLAARNTGGKDKIVFERMSTIRGHDAPVTHAAVTPNGHRLVTGDIRGAVRVTDFASAMGLSAIDPTPAYQRHVAPVLAPGQATVGSWITAGRRQLAALINPQPKVPAPCKTAEVKADGTYAWRRKPVTGDATFQAGFGMRRHPILQTLKMHVGVDWLAPVGTPIIASADGRVVDARGSEEYGNTVVIEHAGTAVGFESFETVYAHLDSIAPGLKAGDCVAVGTIIGTLGNTGQSAGPHLHFEVRLNGKPVDPMAISPKPQRNVAPIPTDPLPQVGKDAAPDSGTAALETVPPAAPKPTPPEVSPRETAPPTPAPRPAEVANGLISPEAKLKIIEFEVTSQQVYDRRYSRPTLPSGEAGIQIGIGYDLGYATAATFKQDWTPYLEPDAVERLKSAVGLRSTAIDNSAKKTGKGDGQIRLIAAKLADINVPWDAAIAVFENATLPRFERSVLATFPNAAELHPHAFGALVSLVYNRGNSLEGDRRTEMRNIADHMAARAFEKVPNEIRAMKRLAQGQPGLAGVEKRREAEAVLFERGLEAMGRARLPTVSPQPTNAPPLPATRSITPPKNLPEKK